MVSTTTVRMVTVRNDYGINYKVLVTYESEDCLDETVVWEQRMAFVGDRRDGPRARILAREQEKMAAEQQRKYSGAWRW